MIELKNIFYFWFFQSAFNFFNFLFDFSFKKIDEIDVKPSDKKIFSNGLSSWKSNYFFYKKYLSIWYLLVSFLYSFFAYIFFKAIRYNYFLRPHYLCFCCCFKPKSEKLLLFFSIFLFLSTIISAKISLIIYLFEIIKFKKKKYEENNVRFILVNRVLPFSNLLVSLGLFFNFLIMIN